jgi:hypothetical protein
MWPAGRAQVFGIHEVYLTGHVDGNGPGRIRNERAETGNDPATDNGRSGHKLNARGRLSGKYA